MRRGTGVASAVAMVISTFVVLDASNGIEVCELA